MDNFTIEKFSLNFDSLKNEAAKNQIINELKKHIIIGHYLEDYCICNNSSEEELNILLNKFCKTNNFNNGRDLSEYIAQTGMTKEKLKGMLLYEKQIEQLKNKVIFDQEIINMFLNKKTNYDNVTFGILKAENGQKSQELYDTIINGKSSFEDTAKEHSTGEENRIIGPVALKDLNPELKNKLENMRTGEISEPFSPDGQSFLIVKLLNKQCFQLNSKVRENLKNELFKNWLNRQINLFYPA